MGRTVSARTLAASPLPAAAPPQSTMAAAFGVQSNENRKRDFTRGKASHFILMGIAFTTVFVLVLVGIVRLILSVAA